MSQKPELSHDGSINIAIGKSRRELNWKNREMLWSDLVHQLSETHRTAETIGVYMKATKDRQDEIKDVGGFVGAYLSGGRRKKGSVLNRQLLTLDLDNKPFELWQNVTLLFPDNAALIYSTHKHTPDNPRYRLLMPLDRAVMPDEHEAIARWVAGQIDIEQFDLTTFQAERLMYWPSTSKDAVYEFEYQDAPFLSADAVLAKYTDWTDSSEWPISEKANKVIDRMILKQGDPLEKPGFVGVFCRTYTVPEAIDIFLPDIYDACDIDNRYTYKEGSTSGGMIVYDEKFAFSHHGTDPIGGKLCNAFDFVRLHKFGLKDEDAREGTPTNKLPSYKAMMEFISKDPKVRRQSGMEKLSDAAVDFALDDIDAGDEADLSKTEGSPENEEVPNHDWLDKLTLDKNNNYHCTINNILTVLNNDPGLKDRLGYDLFEHREIALKNLPWRKLTDDGGIYLSDADDSNIRHYLEHAYGLTGEKKIQDALTICMMQHSFHPIKDYLNKCKWDGQKRLERLFIDYMGAADNQYTRDVTRKSFAAAVARVFDPGCQYDYVPVLVGPEGKKKSTLLKTMGRQWFSDSFTTVEGTKAFEQLQGVWFMEIAELAGLRKADINAIKTFISKRIDRFRVAYGHRTENFPRQCVFFGTANDRDFLKSANGNRRFWPLDIYVNPAQKDVHKHLTTEEVSQLWAEAVCLYRASETLYLNEEMEQVAFMQQQQHSEQDERAGMVQQYLDTLLPKDWNKMDVYQRRAYLQGDDELKEAGVIKRMRVCIPEIWVEVLGGNQKDMNNFNTKQLHIIMRHMDGWQEIKTESGKIRFGIYGPQKGYVRKISGNVLENGSVAGVPQVCRKN